MQAHEPNQNTYGYFGELFKSNILNFKVYFSIYNTILHQNKNNELTVALKLNNEN